jgi:hypothetical protein
MLEARAISKEDGVTTKDCCLAITMTISNYSVHGINMGRATSTF